MLITMATIYGVSLVLLASGAALCRWSPRVKRELLGEPGSRDG